MNSPTVQHILVAHDFGEPAQGAFEYALGLAGKLNAHVTVVHAYDLPSHGFEGLTAAAELEGHIKTAARTALDEIVVQSRGSAVEVDAILRTGPPWSEITSAARETRADLIVVGTHGRRGLSRAMLGSVAERVVRSAPCPVLTVHGATLEL
jgi:nucleotide-binding universal stress UspA family protein